MASSNQSNPVNQVEEQVRKQIGEAQELMSKSVHAWNELMIASADMAYDTVLKSWNYSRSMRSGAEQAVEDALTTQARLAREMMQAWQGYVENAQSIFTKNGK